MPKLRDIRYALVAFATVGVFALTGFTNAGPPPTPTTAAQPNAGPAAPYSRPSAAPYRYQPRYPREDLPCNPPGTWEVYPSPTTNDLTAVDFVDVNNGWACGPGVILRYRNGAWTEEPGQATRDYRDLDMVTTTDGWAVGREGTTDIWTIWRWDGSSWNVFQTVTGAIYCIDMIDANHGWIGGNGYFLRYNGSNWVSAGYAPSGMFGIHMFSDNEGRAVGYRYIMRREGSAWVVESNNNWVLGDISMVDNRRGYGSGYDRATNKGAIVAYNGTWILTETFSNSDSIGGLDTYENDLGWCVGRKSATPPYGGFIGFFDGSEWVEVNSPTGNGLAGVTIVNRENAWIVGYYGTILKFKPNVAVNPCSLGGIKAIYR